MKEFQTAAQTFVKQKLPELLRTYIDSGAKITVDRNEDHALGNKRRVLLSGSTIQVEYGKVLIEEKVELEKYHDNRRKTLDHSMFQVYGFNRISA